MPDTRMQEEKTCNYTHGADGGTDRDNTLYAQVCTAVFIQRTRRTWPYVAEGSWKVVILNQRPGTCGMMRFFGGLGRDAISKDLCFLRREKKKKKKKIPGS